MGSGTLGQRYTHFPCGRCLRRPFLGGGSRGDIHGDAPEVRSFILDQNYPNPFNPVTVIRYHMQRGGSIELKVLDLLGREVATLFRGYQYAGTHSATFDAAGFPTGMYLYSLKTPVGLTCKRMLLVR